MTDESNGPTRCGWCGEWMPHESGTCPRADRAEAAALVSATNRKGRQVRREIGCLECGAPVVEFDHVIRRGPIDYAPSFYCAKHLAEKRLAHRRELTRLRVQRHRLRM